MYTHLYYLTGISKALEPLFCQDELDARGYPTGTSFLVKEPAIQCFGELHSIMLGLDVMALVVYGICCPLAYLYIFFVLVPRTGLHNPRMKHVYGFMWSRFEERVYWWESVELVRKIGVVVVVAVVTNPVPQSLVSVVLIGFVFTCSITLAPFIRRIYDVFDCVATATIMIFILLGVLLEAVRTDPLMDAGLRERYMWFCSTLAISCFIATCIFGSYAIQDDLIRNLLMRRVKRVRKKLGLSLPESLFLLDANATRPPNPAIVEYVEGLSEEKVRDFRRVERKLMHVCRKDPDSGREERVAFMRRQFNAEPALLNWMLADEVKNEPLLVYMRDALEAERKLKSEGEVGDLISNKSADAILLWLAQGGTAGGQVQAINQEERAIFREAVREISNLNSLSEIMGLEEICSARGAKKLRALYEAIARPIRRSKQAAHGKVSRIRRSGETRIVPAVDALASSLGKKAPQSRASLLLKKESALNVGRLALISNLEDLLQKAIEETYAEAMVLIPLEDVAGDVTLPRVVVVRGSDEMTERDKEAARAQVMAATDWKMGGDTPSGVCRATKMPVHIENVLLDKRFRVNFLTSGDALSAISQLCVPVFDEGGELLGILKCLNKESANGDRAGLPFDAQDEDVVSEAANDIYAKAKAATTATPTRRTFLDTLRSDEGSISASTAVTSLFGDRALKHTATCAVNVNESVQKFSATRRRSSETCPETAARAVEMAGAVMAMGTEAVEQSSPATDSMFKVETIDDDETT